MNKSIWIILLGIILMASCIIYVPYEGEQNQPPPNTPRQERTYGRDYDEYPSEMDMSDFYEYLSPHGIWVNYSPYGYVWIPRHVGYNWRPYTNGRWIRTNYGWTWLSYYDWGWVPFHYGRWGWDRRMGWYWVPGTIWAPAWVSWRWSNLYIGWAPLPPGAEFVAGVGIAAMPDDFPDDGWVFVEGQYFQYDYLDRYVQPYERNSTLVRLTVHKANLAQRNRQLFNDGVDVEQVRRVTRADVSQYELEDAKRPGQSRVSGELVQIYRPTVRKNEAAKPKSFWQKEEAEERVPEIRRVDLEGTVSTGEMERKLKEEQDKEIRLLEHSQERETADLKRKVEDEKKLASKPEEKEKAEKEYQVKSAELKKAHTEERAKISQRHQEEEKVVKDRVKKKEKD